jgi:hypothetical protein
LKLNPQALALAGVKGPHKPFDPKGRAFPFGSRVKGSCRFFQEFGLRSLCLDYKKHREPPIAPHDHEIALRRIR